LEEILSYLIKQIIENGKNNSIIIKKSIVFAVPSCFGIQERILIKKAAMLANIIENKISFINETTAAALAYELKKRDLKVERQIEVPILYDGKRIDTDLRLDILVEDLVIVELKSVLEMKDVFYLQIDTYLKLTGKHLGLLVNFNTDDIVHSIHRRVK
jgi:GxxExxY protein